MMKHLHLKMRLATLLFAFFLGLGTAWAVNYNFSAVCSTGQTLYYKITNSSNGYVSVVAPGGNSSTGWNGYTKPTGTMLPPNTVTYNNMVYSVTSIAAYAFYGCNELTEVTIPENITSVGNRAFWMCPGIESVHFNAVNCSQMETGTSPKSSVFNSSSITDGSSAIATVTIGDDVTRIPDYAFKNAEELHGTLSVPASVESIGNYAFNNCISLNFLSLVEGLVTIGDYAFSYCTALEGRHNPLPRGLYLPNSVTTVGNHAFYHCNILPLLSIGEGVNSIGGYAFWNCPALQTVIFNAIECNSMYTYDSGNYYSVFGKDHSISSNYPPIVNLTIGEHVTKIPDYAFDECSRIQGGLVFPNTLLTIGNSSFYYCSGFSGSLNFDNALTSIGNYAFGYCSGFNGSLNFDNALTSIGNYAFGYCSGLSGSLSIPNFVTFVGDYAFRDCTGLNGELTIGTSLAEIKEGVFYNCCNLIGPVIIHDIVTSIGKYAFYGCSNITELTLGTGLNTIQDYAFWNCPALTTVHFNPTNCTKMNTKKNLTNYSVFSTYSDATSAENKPPAIVNLSIGNNVTRIPDYAFRNSQNLISDITIPNSTTYIGAYSFYGAKSAELTIGTAVDTIRGNAFYVCPNLETVHFNATCCNIMKTDSESVFSKSVDSAGYNNIHTLTIGDNVTRIPEYAFKGSDQMNCSIYIPDACTFLGTYSFAYCSGHDVFTGKNVTTIKAYTFYSSSGFDGTLTLGDQVTSIGSSAFYNCHGFFDNLILPDVLVTIGSSAFYNCYGFSGDLIIPHSVTSIENSGFYHCYGFDGSLILGSGLTTINPSTFYDCHGFVKALILGRNISSIGSKAFYNCNGFSYLIATHTPSISASSDAFGTSPNSMNFSIPVYIPYGTIANFRNSQGWRNFTNYTNQCLFENYDSQNWSESNNWGSLELPIATDVVCINGTCKMDISSQVRYVYIMDVNKSLTINEGVTLSSTFGIGNVNPTQLVIEDGGAFENPLPNAYGTVKKNISAHSGSEGWYTLATPIYKGVSASIFSTGTYDLYYYDEPAHYWRNEKKNSNNFERLQPAQGCLYANQSDKTIEFVGQINASSKQFEITVTHDGGPLAGYNLIGNPYTNNININDVKINGIAQTSYYKIVNGSNLVAYTNDEPIGPCEGFFVVANSAGTVTFNHTRNEEEDSYVRFALSESNSNGSENKESDRTYLNIGDGKSVEKLRLGGSQNLLYFMDDDKQYAIADLQNTNEAAMLCLEVFNSGHYTIEATQINTTQDYLHLIDAVTGSDIDLLVTPRYSFEAVPRDDIARFAVIFSPDATIPMSNGMNNRGTRGFRLPSFNSSYDSDAYFDENATITVTANPTSGGTVTGGGTYQIGTQCTLTATPASGYTFTKWMRNGTQVSTSATYTFTVTGSASYVAVFTPNSYSISATANPSEGGTVSGAGNYNHGSSCTLTATPATGYTFTKWTKNGTQVSTNPNYTFTVTENASYVAVFTIKNYTVTATANPTSGGAVAGGGNFNHGASCTLTATPVTGYTFTKWTKNGSQVSTNPTYTFSVTETASYVAVFTINSYVVTATANPATGGTVTGDGNYNHGASCTLRATANTGYTFSKWTKNGTQISTNSTCTFIVTEAASYEAVFIANTYNITAEANPPEAGSVNGAGTYEYGSTCTLRAITHSYYDYCYYFTRWEKDGVMVSENPSYSFTVTESGNYVAVFTPYSFDIHVNATPMTGGTVSGDGTYDFGTTCTLTATPAAGFIFVEWTTQDGTQVSTNPSYSFTVVRAENFTARFISGTYSITAIANPSEGGTVTGAGNYGYGVGCTLTASPNSGYSFVNWTENGIVVSSESSYSFNVTQSRTLLANFNSTDSQQTTALAPGWNWWSSYVELSGIDGLTMLEESLGNNGLQIVSQNNSLQNYYPDLGYNYWFGSLSGLQNESGYKVKVSASCNATMTGSIASPDNHPISIQPNWNWIGYPCSAQQSLASAIGNYVPSNDDVIKNQFSSAIYYEGYGWFPDTFILSPGQCYMYKSTASSTKTMSIVNGRSVEALSQEQHQWTNDAHAYADNMSLIAVVKVDGEEKGNEGIELGAFVNGECRGSALLKYFEPTGRWYAVLTITGENGDAVSFGIIDKVKGERDMRNGSSLTFTANAVAGSLDEPYEVNFGTTEMLHIYPNPVERNSNFAVALPDDEIPETLFLANALGETVRHETGVTNMTDMHGLDVAGVYTIRVICQSGNTYWGKLIVK